MEIGEKKQKTAPVLVHGGDWAGFSQEYGFEPLDFSANVSPFGVPEGVKQAISEAAEKADRYPDPLCRSLCEKIGAFHQVDPAWVLCGNGAADLIFRAVLAKKPKTAVITAPTFAEYETALSAVGCQVRRYVLQEPSGFRLEEDFLSFLTPDVDMVFLCEPNNPTGLTSPRDFLVRVAEKCRRYHALLIIDECFGSFLEDPSAHTMQGYLQDFPNLLLLKAFTKLYAMAGVRLGYSLCADLSLKQAMAQAGQPWSVSSLAQAAGEAALLETEYVEMVRQTILQQRPFMQLQLESLGLKVIPGEVNYLLFSCEKDLISPLRERGILLRSCGNYYGLSKKWYRTAVRREEENKKLLQALKEIL